MALVVCPYCGTQANAPDQTFGHRLRCPKCRRAFDNQQIDPPSLDAEDLHNEPSSERSASYIPVLGWLVFSWMFASAVSWCLALGFTGTAGGTVLTVFASIITIGNLAFAVLVFLLSIRDFSKTKDWVAVAAATGAGVSFLLSCCLSFNLLSLVSLWILGQRAPDFLRFR